MSGQRAGTDEQGTVAAKAAPESPTPTAESTIDLNKVDMSDGGGTAKPAAPAATPKPKPKPKAQAEPEPEEDKTDDAKKPELEKDAKTVMFISPYDELELCIEPPDVMVKAGLRRQIPGYTAVFLNGVFIIEQDKVYYEFDKTKIDGGKLLTIFREHPRFGNTFQEVDKDLDKHETVMERMTRLKGMSESEVRAEANRLGIKSDPNLTKEGVILEVLAHYSE